ncbi:MAG: RNA-binding protein [Dehalococcoidales bacterium]|nr:RNA-binding protein [Dehalococcoidales bacterium]
MNLYVGNLSREPTEDELRQAFEPFGQVTSANIIKDRYSGESRGFGFVEMATKSEAQAAINGVNGTSLGERTLSVSEARPRTEGGGGRRPFGGGGFGGGGGGGRGGAGGGGGRGRRY